jgi:hypothetical protein
MNIELVDDVASDVDRLHPKPIQGFILFKMVLAISIRVLLFLSTTPFC